MRLDAHQHFWRYNTAEFGWMGEPMAALRRDFLPAELAAEQVQAGLDGSIVVEARQCVAETQWLLELARENPRLKGVVGWLDLRSETLAGDLERFAADRRLRGLRHVLQDEPAEFMLAPEFLRGLGLLCRHGLTYDILISHSQLPHALEMVSKFPDQPFVVDHIAKPPIAKGRLEPWASGLRKLARLENVWCKLSGMVTEADWRGWKPVDLQPYIEVAVEAFGPRRLMIGSDWPVCTLAGDYQHVLGVVTEYVKQLSPAEQDDILGRSAAGFYGVP